MEPRLTLLIGLQAAGKSTFYREHLAATHAILSKDLMPRSARHREARLRRELDALLVDGWSVAVDNTQPARADRAGVLAVAAARGVPVVGYWWPPDLELSRTRNARRAHPVPEVALVVTAARWQRPQLDEGFAALVAVGPSGHGA